MSSFLTKISLTLLAGAFIFAGSMLVFPNISFANSHTATTTTPAGSLAQTPPTPTDDAPFVNPGVAGSGEFLVDALKCTGIVSCIFSLPQKAFLVGFYLVSLVASFLMMIAGMMFDYSLMLSITKDFINQDFVTSSWTIVRDFSNMLFIFILLYTGVETILGVGNWRRTVLMVVIMALLINFSLFFTKVVIDAGNILAVGVYEALGSSPGSGKPNEISGTLVSAFQPQNFIVASAEGTSSGEALIVFAISIAVSLSVAWVFFMIALVFFGRILAFWFLMIVAPFAFISIALPKGNIFNEWVDTLLKQVFIAPLFLFLMYIIMKIVEAKPLEKYLVASASGAGGLADKILLPVLIATLLVVALMKTKDLVTKMSGDFGSLGAKIAGGVMGAATGGVALAGQKIIGRAALNATKNDSFRKFAATSPWGRAAYNLTDKTANAGFDVRGLPMGDKLGLGKGRDGSFAKTVEEAKKKDVAFNKKIATGKDGKPLTTTYETTETRTDAFGEITKEKVKKEGTTTQAFTEQLKQGYFFRTGTGGNIGAEQAAKELAKNEEKRQKEEAKKEKLGSRLKNSISDYKTQLKVPDGSDIDGAEAVAAREKFVEDLEGKVARAEAELDYVKTSLPNDIDAHTEANILKKKAEKALKKFKDLQVDIEKTQKELEKIEAEKDKKKKDDSTSDKKDDKH